MNRNKNASQPFYGRQFYDGQQDRSLASARVVIPDLLALFAGAGVETRSCVDLGAGMGGWLKAAGEAGITDALAIEGEWVKELSPLIEEVCYQYADIGQSLDVSRRFDLAICVEVAEHINSERAETVIDNLTALSEILLFSAAIPGQGGTHHVNEKWPTYWHELLIQRGYRLFDVVRWKIWHREDLPFWHRQNLLLYVHSNQQALSRHLASLTYEDFMPSIPIGVVHPIKYGSLQKQLDSPGLKRSFKALPVAMQRAISRRLIALRRKQSNDD